MTVLVFRLLGGIGLFLLGMMLMTDGLKSFAGDALRKTLLKFTGSPVKAFASGVFATALVQSSSVTTVTVIGFVSAGLLTFPQAVGLVIGASLGTTGTGWIVSVLGLKVNVGFYALPLVFLGAFTSLLARGRWKSLGTAVAGFGMIFVGIETMQLGMQGLSGVFRFSEMPSAGLLGHAVMVLIGSVMTVIMQSSSAAVATTLTALHTGSVSFEQAASIVIGAAIGTTVTGVIASMGASVSTRRTALAHVLFNLATGAIALLFLPLFLKAIAWAQATMGLDPGAVSLAAFHTAFIAMGVVLFLPLVGRFSSWLERLLPEKGPVLTRHLDPSVLNVPAVALEASRRALSETACGMFTVLRYRIGNHHPFPDAEVMAEYGRAIEETQVFFSRIPPVGKDMPLSKTRVAQLHAIEHLVRLLSYLEPPAALRQGVENEHCQAMVGLTREILAQGEAGLSGAGVNGWLERVEKKSLELSELHRRGRPLVLQQTAGSGGGPLSALNVLDAMRRLDRLGYHVWRICTYLGGEGQPESSLARGIMHPAE